MAIPHRCPICKGSGKVRYPILDRPEPSCGTSDEETCPACDGTRIVWETPEVVVEAVFQKDVHATG